MMQIYPVLGTLKTFTVGEYKKEIAKPFSKIDLCIICKVDDLEEKKTDEDKNDLPPSMVFNENKENVLNKNNIAIVGQALLLCLSARKVHHLPKTLSTQTICLF